MVDTVIRGLLGNWGQVLLDTYLQYSLFINAALFAYALLIILARRNYYLILDAIVSSLEDRYQGQLRKKTRQEIEALLKTRAIPWEQAMQATRYPLLTHARGLTPHLKTVKTLQRLYPLAALADRLSRAQKEQPGPAV